MQEPKWWSRAFLVTAVICLFLLIAAPFTYKYGVSELSGAFSTLMLGFFGALLVFVVGLGMAFYTNKKEMTRDRNILLMAIGIALIPMLMVGPQIGKGRSVPAIHNISTDTVNPPEFVKVKSLRSETDNSLTYAFEGSATKLAELQNSAYPDLKSIISQDDVATATERSAQVLTEMGLEVVNKDAEAGIVEAVATTFWFGFKDDVVVRIAAVPEGSKLDLRSVSRVGRSDLGVNASRIQDFTSRF